MVRALLALLVLILLPTAAHAEKRVALVIGNSAYKVGPLANPANDADAMAAAFRRLGFDRVLLYKDLGFEQFRAALVDLAREASGADLAVVYFAGHGIEVDGKNFLIPIDAKLVRADDLNYEAIALDTVLDRLASVTKLKLVILDASRNNIFPLTGGKRSVWRGLARVEPVDNTLVVYAAKDGTSADDGGGRHSPFTEALLKHVATPNLDIRLLFGRVRDDVMVATNAVQQPHVYGTIAAQDLALHPVPVAVVAPPTAMPYTPVRVFFGTDRKRVESPKGVQFGAERAAHLQLGQAIVTVPKTPRKRGEVARPAWWERWVLRVPPEGDPTKHFTILPQGFALYTSPADFMSAVREHMKEAGDYKEHVFVFVHGFNMSFDDALFRTAQITYDLGYVEPDGVHVPFGTAFLYSWPSGGELKDYVYDVDSARLAANHLHKFLELVASRSGAAHVHLIAHSMGNVALLSALQKFAATPRKTPLVSQIILAAPDVDAAEFERIANAIVPVAKGITLYASSNDLAMKAARDMRRGVPRAGDIVLGNPLVVEKIYTIDVSALSTDFFAIKHGRYSESRELLEDMRRILAEGKHPPDKRNSNFVRRVKGRFSYWWYSQ